MKPIWDRINTFSLRHRSNRKAKPRMTGRKPKPEKCLSHSTCGYHGPKLGFPIQPAQPKSPKGARPKSQSAQERPINPPPGYPKGGKPKSQPAQESPVDPPLGCPKGIRPKSQPAQKRLVNPPPGHRVLHIPDAFLPRCLLSRSATPPNEAANRLFMLQM